MLRGKILLTVLMTAAMWCGAPEAMAQGADTVAVDTSARVRYSFGQTQMLQQESANKQGKAGARYGLYAGWGRRTAKEPTNQGAAANNFYRKMRDGVNVGIDYTYFSPGNQEDRNNGFGIKINNWHNSISLYSVTEIENILFGEAMYSFRKFGEDRKSVFWLNLGLGMYWYYEKVDSPILLMTGGGLAMGYNIDLGYDVLLKDNLYFGIAASLYTGALTYMDYMDENSKMQRVKFDKDEYIGLAQYGITAGIKYHF